MDFCPSVFSTFPERTLYYSARTLGLRFYNFFHGSNERCQNLCQISRSRASRTPLQTTFFRALYLNNIEFQRDFPTKKTLIKLEMKLWTSRKIGPDTNPKLQPNSLYIQVFLLLFINDFFTVFFIRKPLWILSHVTIWVAHIWFYNFDEEDKL